MVVTKRVSTRDQHPDAQADALTAAGLGRIFADKASGKLARAPNSTRPCAGCATGPAGRHQARPARLEHLIDLSNDLQARGVDLVVLDQGIDTSTAVGRTFFQILGAIAEFEHALMSERTRGGLEAARARVIRPAIHRHLDRLDQLDARAQG
jgi:DNA invertase Pin-like site-specific DNA recombinase